MRRISGLLAQVYLATLAGPNVVNPLLFSNHKKYYLTASANGPILPVIPLNTSKGAPLHRRFNLPMLRGRRGGATQESWYPSPSLSRRSFLGITSAGLASSHALAEALDEFSLVRVGRTLQVTTGSVVRWSINPANFGAAASVQAGKLGNSFEIELKDAIFPGTTLPADLSCCGRRSRGVWKMTLTSAVGQSMEADWMRWLQRRELAAGWWRPGALRPLPGFLLETRGSARVTFSPDWIYAVRAPATAMLEAGDGFDVKEWSLALNHPERIAAESPDGKSTTFILPRGDATWPAGVARESGHGWRLDHGGQVNLFDELRVEAVEGDSGPLYSALLSQGQGNRAGLRFFPGGGFFTTFDEPFHLRLEDPRLVFSLGAHGRQSALFAELSPEPAWAHTDEMSLMFTGSAENSSFEFEDDGSAGCCPKVEPLITAVQCPAAGDCSIRLKFDKPRPTPLNWADFVQPIDRVLGALHLAPWEHRLAFDLSCGDILTVLRPTDMLKLDFEFQGLRLISGPHAEIVTDTHGSRAIDPRNVPVPGEPTIEPDAHAACPPGKCLPSPNPPLKNCASLHCIPGGPPLITVTFPPQHVNEQAFFHQKGDNPGANDFNVHTEKFTLGDDEFNDLKNRSGNSNLTPAQALNLVDPDLGVDVPGPAPDQAPIRAQNVTMSGSTSLVFNPNLGHHGIPFRLENLLDWSKWTPVVHPVACESPTNQPGLPNAFSDISSVTRIELPYRLFLSPNEKGAWAHSRVPVVGKSNAVELWHTRLGVGNKTATPDENNAKDRTTRAIYTPDLNPQAVAQGGRWLDHQSCDPRFALDGRDRQELVYLTSYFGTGAKPLTPLPVQLDHLMLTPLGGYLKSLGTWNPPMLDTSHVLTVEQWKHIATLGRDQYVRVVYKGYLAPFCHRASLIKVTERRIVPVPFPNGAYYAMLHQRMYIVVQNPRRDFPVFGQPNGARNFPFRRVDALTLVTPNLDDPGQPVPENTNIMVGQSLFWPVVNNAPFLFRFRFWDMENNISEASLPVVFGDAETSQTAANCQNMVDLYNQGAGSGSDDDTWTCTPFNAQSVAFAPTTKPGDTRYDASEMCWRICLQPIGPTTVQQVYELNLPLFYPKLFQAQVASASIKRITGDPTTAKVRFYPGYVTSGFDPTANAGEVILQVNDTTLPALRFGAAGKTDQAGGLSSPDTLVVGFSRKSGPVGGTAAANPAGNGASMPQHPSLQTWASGTFNPADFFGGFASAKLLGAVKLSDIIGPLLGGLDSNLGDAPRMVEQELFQIENAATDAENDAIGIIGTLQTVAPANPFPKLLAAQAQAVLTAKAARDAATPNDGLPLLLAHASLIQAIVAYGEALKSLLQDPTSLFAAAGDTLLDQLLNDQKYKDLLNSVLPVQPLVTQLGNQVSTAVQGIVSNFFTALQALQTVQVADPLPINIVVDGASRAQVQLQKLAPEIFALLQLGSSAQDLILNIGQIPSAITQLNVQGLAKNLNAIGNDTLAMQQALGVLGIAVPVPQLVSTAKAIEGNLTSFWNSVDISVSTVTPLLDNLQSACSVLAAQPLASDPTSAQSFTQVTANQVLQNFRQIQRTIGHLQSLAGTVPNPPPDDKAHRWLQRLQQSQRQLMESANALQKVATDVLTANANNSSAGDLIEAAANLLIILVPPAGTASLVEQITCLSNLALAAQAETQKTLEQIVDPIRDPITDAQNHVHEIGSSLKVQLDSLKASLAIYRGELTLSSRAQVNLANLRLAIALALADDINPAVSPPERQVAHGNVQRFARALVTDQIIDELVRIAAARLQVYDLAIRYQNCVASVVSWSVYFANQITDAAFQPLQDLAAAVSGLSDLLVTFLDAVSAAGNALYNEIQMQPALSALLADSCDPLQYLPAPVMGTPISELLDDTQTTMAKVNTAITDVESRARQAVSDEQALAAILTHANSLTALIARLPVPHQISFSFAWQPTIKSFEPVFLLDDDAAFTINAQFEVDVLALTQPTYNISASLTNFSINLIGSPSFVIVGVKSLVFTSTNGNKPDCRLTIGKIGFGQDLSFVQDLASLLDPSNGPFVEFTGGGVTAGFRFQVPDLTMGAFNMMQLAIETAVQLSFNGDPVRCQFGISDQTNPFLLSAGIFGGGGFFQLQLGLDGVQLLQGALEFGLVAAINIGILEGSGFVVAGIYMSIGGSQSKVCGFVHAHGHMDIFGIVSMDIDVYVGVCYASCGVVSGTASFTVSIQILFFSASYTLQASYQYQGSCSGNTAALASHTAQIKGTHSGPAPEVEEDFVTTEEEWAEFYEPFAA